MRDDWAAERAMMRRWARWCVASDTGTLRRLCGLSWAGSPHAIMDSLWMLGAAHDDDVTGYAPDIYLPDYASMAVEEYMCDLRQHEPATYQALMVRHARVLHGQFHLIRSEVWLAQSLFGRSRSHSARLLSAACDRGYRLLAEWMVVRQAVLPP